MNKIKLKKPIVILFIVVAVLLIMIGTYGFLLTAPSHKSEEITFVVREKTSKKDIVADLKTAGLIRSKTSLFTYLVLNKNMILQAGTYSLNRNMSAPEIIKKINKGDVKLDTVTLTFVEGKNVNDLISLISTKFSYPEKDVKAVFEDKKFIKKLMESYDFLTIDILNDNIYYALEGYLFPDTYEFLEGTSVEDIIIAMLNNTKAKFSSVDFSGSEYTLHEILSMASIVELEAVKEKDRGIVAQVIYKRLQMGESLGMDVTTYYAVHKKIGEPLTTGDLSTINGYNTNRRNTNMVGKLPVGPICNPSLMSIKAVLNPSDTDYLFFYADIRTGEIYFSKTYEEHMQIIKEVG